MCAYFTDGEVDGFSDVTSEDSEVVVSSPDPGFNRHAAQPLSPEEYVKLQREARIDAESKELKSETGEIKSLDDVLND